MKEQDTNWEKTFTRDPCQGLSMGKYEAAEISENNPNMKRIRKDGIKDLNKTVCQKEYMN